MIITDAVVDSIARRNDAASRYLKDYWAARRYLLAIGPLVSVGRTGIEVMHKPGDRLTTLRKVANAFSDVGCVAILREDSLVIYWKIR